MYKDRGIIKWAPFDALIGFNQMIADIKYKMGKKDKPILSEDHLEHMNRQIRFAVEKKEEVRLNYYEDGYFYEVFGHIKYVDMIKKIIVLSVNQEIYLENIMNIYCEVYENQENIYI